jgi:hypothetical protein
VKCKLKPGSGVVQATLITWPYGSATNAIPVAYATSQTSFGNCFDGLKNGFETGIDCGGLCAAVCPPPSANVSPIVVRAVPNQSATVGRAYALSFKDPPVFVDSDGDAVSIRVTGLPATAGLVFDPFAQTISGTPTATGVFLLSVIGSDNKGGGAGDAYDSFTLTISANAGVGSAVASCTDGVRNGIETGVDCGGWCRACNQAANLPPQLTVSRVQRVQFSTRTFN